MAVAAQANVMSGGVSTQPVGMAAMPDRAASAHAPRSWHGPLLPVLVALLAGVLYASLAQRWHDATAGLLFGAALAALLAGLLARLAAELAALRLLERGIHHAREGLLGATPTNGLAWTTVGRLIPEHNTTVEALAMMFRTVEECQTRFLSERNRIDTILQSSPGALLGVTDDLNVSIANRRAEALFGAEPGALQGRGLFDLLVLDVRGRNLLRDAFLYKLELHDREIELTLAGATRDFSLNLAFYTDDQDDMGGVIILQDITDKRQLMETVAMREKLVAMGQLAAGVAHELNTPLGNILGYAQLIRAGLSEHPTLAGYADIVSAQSQRASRVVQDLLSYARKDACQGETCAVNSVVNEIIEAFIHCRLQRYGIDVTLDLATEELLAEGGCGELDIVFTNVVSNAIQALAGTPAPHIVVSTWREGPMVAISVADNGPGVPAHARGRLFDPFFTTKDVGQGSGLGLFISQAMVTRRGGHIDLDAAHGPGARFVIRLPAVEVERLGRAA